MTFRLFRHAGIELTRRGGEGEGEGEGEKR
jgi:hypothetical protein